MVQESKTLNGRTVVITRPRAQAEATVREIEERGGKPYLFPTIEIREIRDPLSTKAFFSALSEKRVDYVLLMSVNGVKHLLSIADNTSFKDKLKATLNETVIIAVGPKTAQELEKNDIRVDMVPERYTSEGILHCLKQRHVRGKTIYIPRTSEAPPELARKLREMGNIVEEIHVYQSQLPTDRELAGKFVSDLENNRIDAIIFSSSLGVRNFFEMLRGLVTERKLTELISKELVVVAIGPTTARTLEEAGVKVDLVPEKLTIDQALDMLARYWNAGKTV